MLNTSVESELPPWQDIVTTYCPRCIVRLRCHDWTMLRKSEAEIMECLSDKFGNNFKWPSLPKTSNGNTSLNGNENINLCETSNDFCSSCWGLLRTSFLEETSKTVLEVIEKDTYQFESFQILYHLPVQLLISEYVAEKTFKRYFGAESTVEPHDVKEILKVLMEPLMTSKLNMERQADALFEISLHISHPESAENIIPQLKTKSSESFLSKRGKRFHKRFKPSLPSSSSSDPVTIAQIKSTILKLDDGELQDMCSVLTKPCEIDQIKLHHAPVFVGGRYNKYSRSLPQTPWMIDGQRKLENSVQEYLAETIQEAFKAQTYNFSSSGREDVDVQMLGNGRPFLVELINPRITVLSLEEMGEIQKKINEQSPDVSSRGLQIVSKADCKQLKEGEEEKTKSYSALCYFLTPPTELQLHKLKEISDVTDFLIKQTTPIRVLHRRPLAVRPRYIHKIQLLDVENNRQLFRLRLVTQAGTYIKEFVHGDFGRTSPSLKDLVDGEVDIISLDVESVNLSWPPGFK